MCNITIITINYNNSKGLEKTIASVISQKYNDFEYIVIDGGSTDGSKEIIEKYNDRIEYWISEPDKGIYNAMNKGIKEAKGDYLLFLNSGDVLFSSDILSKYSFKLKGFDILYGDLMIANSQGKEKKFVKKYPDILSFYYVWTQSLPHPSSFIKRELFQKVGLYNEKDRITSDWQFFMLALFEFNCTYSHIPDIISVFNSDGLSNNIESLPIIDQEKYAFISQHTEIIIKSGFFSESMRKEEILMKLERSKIINLSFRLGFLKFLRAASEGI